MFLVFLLRIHQSDQLIHFGMLCTIWKLVFRSSHVPSTCRWECLHCQKNFQHSSLKCTICAAMGWSQNDLRAYVHAWRVSWHSSVHHGTRTQCRLVENWMMDWLFRSSKDSKKECIHHILYNTLFGLCASSRLGNCKDTQIQEWSLPKRPFASLYVK
jgi:hypothetical protein